MTVTVKKPINLKHMLLTETLHTVWANPKADQAGIIRTNRITPITGAIGHVKLIINNITLPVPNRRFIVLELGAVAVSLVGLASLVKNVWYEIPKLINDLNVTLLGFCEGRVINETGSYLYICSNNNVLIAMDYANNMPVVRLDSTVYYKFYSNPAFSGTVPEENVGMQTGQLRVGAVFDGAYINFINQLVNMELSTQVAPIVFVNGLFRPNGINPAAIHSGDIIQYLHDPYVVSRTDHDLLSLDGFESTLDSVNKHILAGEGPNDIYVDDVEIYISGLNQALERVGVYYPRLRASDIRMLTYKDWSVSSQAIAERLGALQQMYDVHTTLSQVKIHVLRRNNGFIRNVVLDKNHIADLMNLPVANRRLAMSGTHAVLDIWNADNLEQSAYMTFISKELNDITTDSTDNVFSRSGVIELLDAVYWDNTKSTWCLPISAGEQGGKLIRFNNNGYNPTITTLPQVNNRKTPYINGKGWELFFPDFNLTDPLDIILPIGDGAVTHISAGFGVFCYYIDNGVLLVARRGIDYFVTPMLNSTKITWSLEMRNYERYIRSADKTVIFSITVNRNNLNDGFDIYNGREHAHGVGMGCSMVWANGKYLTEGLDYTVSNGKVYVVTKTVYMQEQPTFLVIYSGLPDDTLTHINNSQWGWVINTSVLDNTVYDLLMYRNYNVYVDGNAVPNHGMITQEAYEDYPDGIKTAHPDGTPYALVRKPFLLDEIELGGAMSLQADQDVVDQQIKDYLSVIFPQQPYTGIVVIPQKYELVSPLMDKVIEAIVTGDLLIDQDHYLDSEIYDKLQMYIHLLDSDPSIRDHDDQFVVISPRWDINAVTVTVNQYSFITQVNRVLLFDKVQGINQYVTIN